MTPSYNLGEKMKIEETDIFCVDWADLQLDVDF